MSKNEAMTARELKKALEDVDDDVRVLIYAVDHGALHILSADLWVDDDRTYKIPTMVLSVDESEWERNE